MKKKSIIKFIGIVVFLFLIWRIYLLVFPGKENSNESPEQPPVAVEIDPVVYEPIQETRQMTGSIHAIYKYIIAPKVSGRIIKINKRIGDWVKRGEIIAKIDDAEYQQAVLEAEASLKISQANKADIESQFKLAKKEYERVHSMQQQGIVSSAELDASLSRYKALQSRLKLTHAQVEQRQATLKSAKIRLGYTVLMATEPGFIGERFVDEGTLLSPNSPVVSVIGIDTVIVRTTVIERVYGKIQKNQIAEIEVDAFPGKVFSGRVSRIAPMLQEASRVAQMEIEVANDSLILKPGMFCKVKVVLSEKESAQVVPSQAIVNRNGVTGIFAVKKGESVAHFIPVQLGIGTLSKSEIVEPEINGMVVTLGQHLLEDGSPVMIPPDQDKN
jgi:RND family efflux transporter MFP subunit